MLKVLLLGAVLLMGCTSEPEKKILSFKGRTMGTSYLVKVVTDQPVVVEELQKQVDDALVEVNRQMSTYQKDSEISKVNQSRSEQATLISPWFAQVLGVSLDIAEKTSGRFDPTIGPLVNLWGFGPKKTTTVPPKNEIQKVLRFVGHQKIRLFQKQDQWFVEKKHSDAYLDLSASAKGFGVDVVSDLLEKQGYKDHLVEIGGELRARGLKNGKPWTVAIEKPTIEGRGIQRILPLKDLAIATSGNYRNFFKVNGKSYSHTLDQTTGRPVRHNLASVTVLAFEGLQADAWATALMTMGLKAGLDYANKNGLAAYFITGQELDGEKKFDTYMSKSFAAIGGHK